MHTFAALVTEERRGGEREEVIIRGLPAKFQRCEVIKGSTFGIKHSDFQFQRRGTQNRKLRKKYIATNKTSSVVIKQCPAPGD